MARKNRGHLPAGIYHVTTRSAGPIALFRDDDDRTMFSTLLIRTLRNTQSACRGFCLMTTHYHLLLEVHTNVLQAGMQQLNGNYGRAFNVCHNRSGHIFGDRYYAVRVETDQHMLALLRYFARNPVEAGLCAKPSDWYWSSYRGCVDTDQEFPFVDSSMFRGYFRTARDPGIDELRTFVGDE
jgi:REP element-mobilizing transposase RayT